MRADYTTPGGEDEQPEACDASPLGEPDETEFSRAKQVLYDKKGGGPAFQVYAAEFLAETATMKRPIIATYTLLLARYWAEKELKNDEKFLAKLVGLKPAEWRKQWPALAKHFPIVGDRITCAALDLQRARHREKREKGKQMAAKRRSSAERAETIPSIALQSARSRMQSARSTLHANNKELTTPAPSARENENSVTELLASQAMPEQPTPSTFETGANFDASSKIVSSTPKASPYPWLAPYVEVYQSAYGQQTQPNEGHLAGSLSPLVKEYGRKDVLAQFTAYCAAAESAHFSPQRFAVGYGEWEKYAAAQAPSRYATRRRWNPDPDRVTAPRAADGNAQLASGPIPQPAVGAPNTARFRAFAVRGPVVSDGQSASSTPTRPLDPLGEDDDELPF